MNIAIILFMVAGMFIFTIGVIGVLRFPDFYSRLHAAGKSDSLGAILVIIAVALYNLSDFNLANALVSIKIMLIAVFIFVASPTATHAVTKAAMVIGVTPWVKGKAKK